MSGTEPIRVSLAEDRFHRLRLIPWWNQDRLADARILVLGAGALGNEIIKNLALLGVGHVRIVDFDRIESSNLSRSVLFSEADEGRFKCEVAAEAAKKIYPDIDAEGVIADIVFDLGWGWYADADVVLSGLDGREARLAANRACAFTGRPFIDGAIEGIDGVARTFTAWDGPCYECTMSDKDWELIRHRHSCNLLSRDQMLAGHVPTTSTVSSVIAGLQVQQALKIIHGLDAQPGTGLHFDGLSFEAHRVQYQQVDECFAHDRSQGIERMPWSSHDISVAEALEHAKTVLEGDAILELRTDVVTSRQCMCGFSDVPLKALLRLPQGAGICPACGARLNLDSSHAFRRDSPAAAGRLADLSVPRYDILRFRSGMKSWEVLLDGDRPCRWPRTDDEICAGRREGAHE